MKVSELIQKLQELPPDSAACVFSVIATYDENGELLETDEIQCHRILRVHNGWYFQERGDATCIEIDRNEMIVTLEEAL